MEVKNRKFLIALLAFVSIATVVGYYILSVTVTTTVKEGISVDTTTFTISMYPAESASQTFHIYNAGSVAIDVSFTVGVSPDAGGQLTVTTNPSGSVSVPGASGGVPGSVAVTITEQATQSIAPNTYTVSVALNR